MSGVCGDDIRDAVKPYCHCNGSAVLSASDTEGRLLICGKFGVLFHGLGERYAEQPSERRSALPEVPVVRPSPRRLETGLSARTVNEMVEALQAPCDAVLPRLLRHVRPTAVERVEVR